MENRQHTPQEPNPGEERQAMAHARDQWSPVSLQCLTPKRTYTGEEVQRLMEALGGLVSDGMPLMSYEIVEKPGWYEVLVGFGVCDLPGARGYEVWSFFKASETKREETRGKELEKE